MMQRPIPALPFFLKGVIMKRIILMAVVIPLVILGAGATESQAGLGLGVHYLNTLGDIKDAPGFDSSALGFLGVYSMGVGLINFEADLEWVPSYAFGKDLWEPSAYAFVGGFIYGGVGIGIGNYDGKWFDDPFYALRVGVKFAMLDVFTSYRFQKWSDLEVVGSDDLNSITFGALFKF